MWSDDRWRIRREEDRQIKLRSSVLFLWNARKASFAFGGAINSEFAEFSLHFPTEETFQPMR